MTTPRRVLVLGGYGMIGAEVARFLQARGHQVTALGRDAATMARVLPGTPAAIRDLRALQTAADWGDLLTDTDLVVNCAGALQSTPQDDLAVVHDRAILALIAACETANCGLIQISAVGVDPDAATEFMATKARGDASIAASLIDWWILRPGLVLAPTAHGGTQLLRMLAAFPLVQPLALPSARIQTVSVFDVARAVVRAVEGDLPPRQSIDLVEDDAHRLSDLVAAYRAWLGFRPAGMTFEVPAPLTRLMSQGADLLGRLGWRSPLRSTALQVLEDGVLGDPAPWRAAGGSIAPLAETLNRMPARAEDRLAARMALLMPVVIGTLALFWALSGLIGLIRLPAAAEVLTRAGWGEGGAMIAVGFWGVVDLALAGALLVRRWAAQACLGMVAVSAIYLVSATIFTPVLWADPLGPLVKILPAMILPLVARAMLQVR